MIRCVGSESGEGGGDLRKQGIGMLQLSLIKGWVGRVSLVMTFVVGAMGVFLMMGGLGEGQERCDADYCIEYPEHGSGAVIVLTALDPEEKDVTWALTENDTDYPDDEAFKIEGGRLTFSTPPDYEVPADVTTVDNVYLVTIEAGGCRCRLWQ